MSRPPPPGWSAAFAESHSTEPDDPPILPPPPIPSSTSTSTHHSPNASPPSHSPHLSSPLPSPSTSTRLPLPLSSITSDPSLSSASHLSSLALLDPIGPLPSPKPISIARLYAPVNSLAPPSHSDYDSFTPAWQPPTHYSLVHKLGRGKYSEVFAGVHDPSRRPVVVKVLKPVKKRKIKREIHVLQTLGGGHGAIRLLDCIRDPATRYCSLVFQPVDCVDFKESFPRMREAQVRSLMRQLLRTLDYAHSQGIMHRDVKPHNVLVDRTGRAHLIDWGLAEYYHPGREYNVRVASRYFKAPELLVGFQLYDYSLDLWSVGCMLAGLLFQTHPFFHGRDNADQLCRIVKVRGTQPLLDYCAKYGIELDVDMRRRIGDHAVKPWTRFVTAGNRHLCSEEALDFLDRLLQIDHQQRLTTQEALQHPYMAALSDEIDAEGKEAESLPPASEELEEEEGEGEEEDEKGEECESEQEANEATTAVNHTTRGGDAETVAAVEADDTGVA